MPLDLSGIKDFLDEEMVDTLRITQDLEGTTDDVFDPATGQYVKPGGDDAVIYEGPGLIMQLNVFPSQSIEGGGTTLAVDYEMHIPLETPPMSLYSRVTVLACDRTPNLVGHEFRVRSLEDNTYSISQAARVYLWEQKATL
jgi:hypothetical protein